MKDAEPLSAHIDKVFASLAQSAELNTEKFAIAEKHRKIALSRYISRVTNEICKSTQIPSYCHLPRPIATLEAQNEKIQSVFDAAKAGFNVFISGGVGTGKTYAACQAVYMWCLRHFRYGIATDISDEAHRGVLPEPVILNFHEYKTKTVIRPNFPIFVNSKNFFLELRKTFDGNGNENEVLERYLAHPLLVFDDLGAEKTTDWTRDRLLHLLETRLYNPKKQTIITSNLSISDVAAVIDDRLSSRMVETCACFRLDGEDLRLRKAVAR